MVELVSRNNSRVMVQKDRLIYVDLSKKNLILGPFIGYESCIKTIALLYVLNSIGRLEAVELIGLTIWGWETIFKGEKISCLEMIKNFPLYNHRVLQLLRSALKERLEEEEVLEKMFPPTPTTSYPAVSFLTQLDIDLIQIASVH